MFKIRAKTSRLSLIIFTLLLMLLFYSLSVVREGRMPWHQQVVAAALTPFQKGVTFIGRGVEGLWEHYFNLVGVGRENDQLKKKVLEQDFELKRFYEVESENSRLRLLLEFRDRYSLGAVGAEVIANDPRGDFRAISVDKGSLDSVSVNMPVVSAAGLVGRVVEVLRGTSRVLLITDPNNAVDVVVQRSRARALLVGTMVGTELSHHYISRLEYLSKKSDILKGDVIVTSGLDGIYPSGIPVGEVVDLKDDSSGVFKNAEVVPFVDFSGLQEVLVVNGEASKSDG